MDNVDLTDVKQEGTNPFDGLFVESDKSEKETPMASSAEEKPTEVAPSQEGAGEGESKVEPKPNTPDDNQNVPLNKDKRFKELRTERDEFKRQLEELRQSNAKEFSDLKGLIQTSQKSAPNEMPPAFKKIFGEGNEHLWQEWQTLFPQQQVNVEDLEAKVLSKLEERQKAEQKAQEDRLGWVNGEIQRLKDNGLKFEKNELLSVLEKYRPIDDEGNLDFERGYELLELVNKNKPENQRNQARKDLASKTSPKGAAEPVESDTVDLAKLRESKFDWRRAMKY